MARQRKYDYGVDDVLMSDADLAELDRYKEAYDAAKLSGNQLGMTAAHEGAEKLRSKYGYSGGASGSEYLPAEQEDFSYENLPNIIERNDQAIRMLQQQIMGRAPFSYDYESDPVYQSYAKQYRREGQRAAADTMGQAAALTGGRPSSWAVTASQQAGNNYAAALADKIPELYQLAYQMYAREGDEMRSNLSTLMGVNNDLYGRWYQQGRDAVADARYEDETAYNRGVYADERDYERAWNENQRAYERSWNEENRDYTRAWNEDDRDYSRGRDAVSDARYDTEWAYQQEQDAYNRAYNRALAMAQYGDFSGFAELGATPEQIARMSTAWQDAQTSKGGKTGGDSSAAPASTQAAARGMMDDRDVAALLNYFPSGLIEDRDAWNELLRYYDEATLNAAGFRNGNAEDARRFTDEEIADMKSGAVSRAGKNYDLPDSGTGTAGTFDFGGNYGLAYGMMISRGVPPVKAGEIMTLEEFSEAQAEGGKGSLPNVLTRAEYAARAQRRDPTLTGQGYGNYEGYLAAMYVGYLDQATREYVRLYGGQLT